MDDFDRLKAEKDRLMRRATHTVIRRETISLSGGCMIIEWPDDLTDADRRDLLEHLELLRRRIERPLLAAGEDEAREDTDE